jgi:hypothetical protein
MAQRDLDNILFALGILLVIGSSLLLDNGLLFLIFTIIGIGLVIYSFKE